MKPLKPLKPYMLRRWRIGQHPSCHYFYTCARPGRTGDPATKWKRIPDDTVHRWILGLPGPQTAIISLLGCKPDRTSEFSFYSFYGGYDVSGKHAGALSFREWLARWHPSVSLCEHPTCDFQQIEPQTLDAIALDVKRLVVEGRTVTLVDSGGQTRTWRTCSYMCAVEDGNLPPNGLTQR